MNTQTNTTPKHTPGPWEVQEEGSNAVGFKIFVIIGPQSAIARVYTAFESEEPGLAESNARLIAAAPDMLLALQRAALLELENHGKTSHWEFYQLAINKAETGESKP